MPIDNVQLKREDVVGSEVVLEDINPKTSTNSVRSTATGDSLDVVLDRIWNAINARLSRVVNSVNGRTGVVVLDASDIGLGKVDNVSFGDIKKWVINMMRSEFKDKNMKLVNDLTELNTLISTNNKSYAGSPFFSTAGYTGDKHSYIGYIYYDEGTKKLEYKSLPINTVGFTDNSLIYNENVNGVDTRGGGLAVNIHKDEDALQLKNPDAIDKSESGLMIDKSRITPQVFMCSGLYYDNELEPDGLLYYDGSGPNDSKTVAIRIDNSIVLDKNNEPCIMKLKSYVKHGDLVMCSFKNDYIVDDVVKTGVHEQLQRRQPCVGYIEAAHWDLSDYIMRLISVDPHVGDFLTYDDNNIMNVNIKPESGLGDTGDNELDVRIHYNGLLSIDNTESYYGDGGLTVNVGMGLFRDYFDRFGDGPDYGLANNLSVYVLDPFTGFATRHQGFYKEYYGGLRYVRSDGTGYVSIAIRINAEDDWDRDDGTIQTSLNLHRGTKGLCIDEESNVLGVQIEPARNDLQIDPSGNLIISDTYMPSLHPLELISNGCGPVYFKGQQPLTVQFNSGLKMTENMKDLDYSIGIKIAEGSCLKIDDNGCLDIDYAKLAEKLKEYNTDSEEPDDTGGDNTGDDSGNTGDDTNPDSGTDTGDTGGSSDYVPEEGEYGDPNNPDTGEGTETTTPGETTNSGET
ncbi:MAG: hypothetical protein IKA36_02510 [Clostridia bacterium]|nr:hypothetical protein [Clostridia bacterium]